MSRKNMICMVAVALLAVVLCVNGYCTKSAAAAAKTGTVNTDGLNVRSGAGTGYAPVQYDGAGIKLNKGTKVLIESSLDGGWYRVSFKYSGKSFEGYVASMYVNTDKKKGVAAEYLGIKAAMISKQKVREKASAKSPYLKNNDKIIKVKAKKSVTVNSVKKAGGSFWYEILFSNGKNELSGYVKADSVKIKKKNIPARIIKKASLRSKAKDSASYVKVKKKKVKLKTGKAVSIIKEKTVRGKKWFNIKCTVKKKTVKGWVQSEYVMFKSGEAPAVSSGGGASTQNNTPVVLSDAEFEADMANQGFPESYKPALRKLHAAYPYWQFKIYNTGLDWNTAVTSETKAGKSLISNSNSDAWKSFEDGAYDWATDAHKIFDGISWVAASKATVSYYMDPRNFMNEKNIFMFEALSYEPAYQKSEGVATILSGTIYGGASYTYTDDSGAQITKTYQDTFIDAAAISGTSPFHLASRMRQEVVTGQSSVSNSVTGTVPGYEGIYNFFNIGATDSAGGGAVEKGLAYAATAGTYLRPWNNPYKSICGGAMYIGSNYINRGQNTLYLERFNVTPQSTYEHQYMTNVTAAYSESLKTYEAYKSWMAAQAIIFYIPVYNGMPGEACAVPSGNTNPNNCLKALSIRGSATQTEYATAPAFTPGDRATTTYTVSVPATEGSVTVSAQTASTKAKLEGTGTIDISQAGATATLTVTAANGDKRTYNIIINRY